MLNAFAVRLYEEHVIQLKGITSDGGRKAKARAMQCYRSALEIDSNHVSTLVRMGALLAEKASLGNSTTDRQALLERAVSNSKVNAVVVCEYRYNTFYELILLLLSSLKAQLSNKPKQDY